MSDEAEFGDIERADTWDADPTIAPEQVAARLYKLRSVIDVLSGRSNPPPWHELPEDERLRLEFVGRVFAERLDQRSADDPDRLARYVHTARIAQEGGPSWDELSPDERHIAVELTELIVEWLEKEGPR